jgi:hypothetical protein
MTKQDVQMLAGFVKAIVRSMPFPLPFTGYVAQGSYNPADGTATAIVGHTLCLDGDVDQFGQATKPLEVGPIPILTQYPGVQAGPVGGERVVMLFTDAGPVLLLHHGTDDSPGAPAGEWWAQHYKNKSTFLKLQNDGALRAGGMSKIAMLSPKVYLGGENLGDPNAVMRQKDGQQLATDVINSLMNVIQTLCTYLQAGEGVAAPAPGAVTAQASATSYTQ